MGSCSGSIYEAVRVSGILSGPGLGGHCIPIDPFYLSWLARKYELSTRFIELAGEINTSMPRYVIDRLSEFLNEVGKPIRGSRICILGMAYKKNVDDARESPSFKLAELLIHRGAILTYSDPHIPKMKASRSHSLPAMQSAELNPSFWNPRTVSSSPPIMMR